MSELRLPFPSDLALRTARLELRVWTAADVDDLHDLYRRPEVHQWLYSTAVEPEGVAALLERKLGRLGPGLGREVNLCARTAASGAFVGDVMLRVWGEPQHRQGEIGFVLHPAGQGQGYATEAAGELLRHGFAEIGFHRIIGRLELRNAASAAVMERLGMRREAEFLENEWVKGAWESEVVYAVLAREWRQQQPR